MKNTTNFASLETFDTLTQEQLLDVSGGFDFCKRFGFCLFLNQTDGKLNIEQLG